MPTFALDARLVEGTSTGDSTYWTCLVRALADLPPQAQFLLFSNKPRPQNIPERENVHWVHLPAKSSRWWSMVQFPLAARSRGAAGIHTQYSLSPMVGRFGITTIHDVSFFIEPKWFSLKDRTLLQTGVSSAAKRARAIIAVSQTDQSEIEFHLEAARGKTHVTYNACPLWVERHEPAAARALLAELFGIREPYLLTLGTRWKRKNMDLAVEAVNGLPASVPHRLIISGKGEWTEKDLGSRGQATGYVSNEILGVLYSGASLYLAPSRHEGFGIPLLEAFRCGCPVMCSSGGAFPEVAGSAGYVEKSWNASDWASSIDRLLSDSSKLGSMSSAGFERERQFSWHETARKTLEIYLNLYRYGR